VFEDLVTGKYVKVHLHVLLACECAFFNIQL